MKKLIPFLILLFLGVANGASAAALPLPASIVLEWDYPSPGDLSRVQEFRIYTKGPGSADQWQRVGTVARANNQPPALSITLPRPTASGVHTYRVTAFEAGEPESDPSNEVQARAPIPIPQNLRIKVVYEATLTN
jgi:hypothetical protein